MSGDQTKPRRKTSGVKTTAKVLSVLVLLLLGTCSVAMNLHKVAWYAVFPYHYYVEIKTDLTVDGEPVQVTGVARCEWVQRVTPLLPEIRGSRWDPRGGILAKRLPKGGAVIVLVRVPCWARGKLYGSGPPDRFWKETRPLLTSSGDLLVQTLLLDDATEPTRIERSFSKAYFADPRSRVHYIGGTYLPKWWARPSDPRDEVPWLRVEGGSKKIWWQGFFAKVTPRERWSKEKAVAAVLQPLTKVTQLTPELLRRSNGLPLTDGVVRTLYLKNGYWDYRPDAPDPDGLSVFYESKDPVTGETIPAGHMDNIFGVESRLSVMGQPSRVTPPIYVRVVYEPGSKTILLILDNDLSISADAVRFGRGSNTLPGTLFRF